MRPLISVMLNSKTKQSSLFKICYGSYSSLTLEDICTRMIMQFISKMTQTLFISKSHSDCIVVIVKQRHLTVTM